MLKRLLLILAPAVLSLSAHPQDIEAVLAHPPYKEAFVCSEHAFGQLPYLGDDLGQDCIIQRFVEVQGRLWARLHAGDGTRNEDWYGWNQEVLSPCSGTVMETRINTVTNSPGIPGKPPGTSITIRRDDGVCFLLAHLKDLKVKDKDRVSAGQVIGRVGNNGFARTPHIHIGAWKDKKALQIRWDQKKMKVMD